VTAKIYFVYGSFTSEGGAKVIDADGSNETLLASGGDILEPDGIEADLAGGKIYFTDMGKGGAADKSVAPDDGKIWRANLDGSDAEIIVPLGVTTTPKQLTLDVEGGKVYWCDRGDVGDQQVNPKVMRANFDGSEIETLISDDLKSPVGIALDTDNRKLYFTDRFANNIKRANLDGSDVEIVVKDTNYPVDLAVDYATRLIYWTAREAGGVLRAEMDQNDIDGKTLKPLVTGLSNPIGVTLDQENKKMYYTEVIISPPSGHIWRSQLDGSNASKIATTPLPLGMHFTDE
jgi:sugar lactone lactonase YvrE